MDMQYVKKITMFEYKGELFKSKDELIDFKNKEIFEEITKLFLNEKNGEYFISSKNLEIVIKNYKIKNIQDVLDYLNK